MATRTWIRVEAAQLEPPPKLAATIRSPIAFHLFGQPLGSLPSGRPKTLMALRRLGVTPPEKSRSPSAWRGRKSPTRTIWPESGTSITSGGA